MAEHTSQKLTVLLHADVAGSTRLVQLNEAVAHDRILDAFRRFSGFIESYGGTVHELRGDALVAEFGRASDAICAALAFQVDNLARNELLTDDLRPDLRVGVSLGEVVIADRTVTGAGVVLAQRLEQLAESGGVVAQGAIAETVPTRWPFAFESLGEVSLKGFDQPTRAFVVRLEPGKQVPAPDPAVALASSPTTPADQGLDVAAIGHGEKPSIAVLPFDNMSAEPDQEFFSDGITEDIITELSRYHSLFVIARNSSFSYKGRSVRVQEIAQDLDAQYVVVGSVRKAGDRVRITAQLIDARNGTHVWGERYERDLGDIFAVQDEIAQTISAAITPEVSQTEQARAHRKPPQSLNAWECYHRGLWHVHRFTLEDMIEAQRLFQRAMDLDPEFGAAYTGLAYALLYETVYGEPEEPDAVLSRARSLAQRGCKLDDHDAMGHFVLGRIYVRRGELDLACGELEKAIQLNPSFATSHFGLGDALLHQYKFEEALVAFTIAARLSPRDPHAWTYFHLQAWTLLGLGRYEEAAAVARQALRYSNVGFPAYLPLISSLGHLGRIAEAKREIQDLRERQPEYGCARVRRLLDVHGEFRDRILEGLRKAGLPE